MSLQHRELRHHPKTIKMNGHEMAYIERGQGAPLVLVHGSLGDFRAWEYQMEPFSADYRTIAVSLWTSYPECLDGEGNTFSVRRHADDLAELIGKLKMGPVHLIAHSRGGCVALILAAEHPQLVENMVLADPAPFNKILPKTPEVIAETKKRTAFVTAAIEQLKRGNMDRGLEIFTDAVNKHDSWQKLPESAKQIRRDNAWSLISLISDAQDRFNYADAKKIYAPTLLVTGDKSPCLYGMMHAALEPCLANHRKLTISNASHGMYRENPQEFNAAVRHFFMKCTSPNDD